MNKFDAVFFIGFGGPEKREDIRPFLERVTRGRGIPSERIEEVAHHYEAIGGASPINAITQRQAEALENLLRAERGARNVEVGSSLINEKPTSAFRAPNSALPLPVYVGNRNWHPFLEDTLRKMAADGIKHAVGFPTAAYRCEASWDRYINAVEAARKKVPYSPEINYIGPWFDHPLFIDATAARVREADASLTASVIFTAHSIPVPMAESSRYVQELETTARLVCVKLGIQKWKLAFTSRSGAPTDPWLEPDVCDEIRAQAKQGIRDILAIPIGFVADHVEVLFDLDVEAQEAARQAGVTLRRAQTVGDHHFSSR